MTRSETFIMVVKIVYRYHAINSKSSRGDTTPGEYE